MFCGFCGKYSCGECVIKERFVPTMRSMEEALEICGNCEMQLLEFMGLNV